MILKDIILRFAKLENLIGLKADKAHSHNEYYTKAEIDAMFNRTLGYETIDSKTAEMKSNKKMAISNNK